MQALVQAHGPQTLPLSMAPPQMQMLVAQWLAVRQRMAAKRLPLRQATSACVRPMGVHRASTDPPWVRPWCGPSTLPKSQIKLGPKLLGCVSSDLMYL